MEVSITHHHDNGIHNANKDHKFSEH